MIVLTCAIAIFMFNFSDSCCLLFYPWASNESFPELYPLNTFKCCLQSYPDRTYMGIQSFGLGQTHDIGGFFQEYLSRIVNQAGLPDEVVHRQGRGKPGCSGGGQHMIGAGDIISHRFRRIFADKNSPGIFNPADLLQGMPDVKLQMLRAIRFAKSKAVARSGTIMIARRMSPGTLQQCPYETNPQAGCRRPQPRPAPAYRKWLP